MSNETYDKMKYVALIILPAIATFLLLISQIIDLPKAEPLAGFIMAVDWLLGKVLGISSEQYKKGE